MNESICAAKAETIDNTGRLVRFRLDGARPCTCRLVDALGEGFEIDEVSVLCPVGEALVTMSPGDERLIETPDGWKRLKLLAVGNGAETPQGATAEPTGGETGDIDA